MTKMKENVLIVDDETNILQAMRLNLGKKYNVTVSDNPIDALMAAGENFFSVIISDLRMPQLNGIMFLEEIEKLQPESSRILLTGQGELKDAVKAINSGKIFRYLSKPCDKGEIEKAIEEGVLKSKDALEKKIALAEYERENSVASIVQDQLISNKMPLQYPKLDFASLSAPGRYISGDFFDILPYNRHCFDILIGDIMGKGLSAGILAAASRNTLMSAAMKLNASGEPPAQIEILREFENEMFERLNNTRTFLTLLIVRVDLFSKAVSYINCGHPGALVVKKNKPETFLLKGNYMPVGIIKNQNLKPVKFKFEDSDRLIMYSDGILEALQGRKNLEPEEVILECLEGNESTSKEVVAKIFDEAFNAEIEKDDLTVLSLQLKSSKCLQTDKSYKLFQRNVRELFRLNCLIEKSFGEANGLFSIAASEVFTNILEHSNNEKSVVRIKFEELGGRKEITFIYRGKSFIPESVELPDCTKPKGFGLYLIEKICFRAYYSRTNKGENCIVLTAKKENENVC